MRIARVVAASFTTLSVAAGTASAESTITSSRGVVEARIVTATTDLRDANPGSVTGDSCVRMTLADCPWDDPRLPVVAGETLTITVDASVTELSAAVFTPDYQVTRLTPIAAGERSYTVVLPPALPQPVALGLSTVHGETPQWLSRTAQEVAQLELPPPPAPPAPLVAPVAHAAPGASVLAPLPAVQGRRARLTVACPAGATPGCAGTITLQTRYPVRTKAGRRVLVLAHVPFSGLPAGARRTLTANLRPTALRQVRGRGVSALRAVVTASDPAVGSVETLLRLDRRGDSR